MIAATLELIARWAEGLGGFFGLFASWGAVRAGFVRTMIADEQADAGSGPDESALPPRLRMLLTIYLVLYAAGRGPASGDACYLPIATFYLLVAVAPAWAAAGTYVCARRAAAALGWQAGRTRRLAALLVALRWPSRRSSCRSGRHRSRWGHWAAGSWLREHAQTPDAVLDTRGWASFASNRPSYDYWHVRCGTHSISTWRTSSSAPTSCRPRAAAATLRAVLGFMATPVAAFPDDQEGASIGVLVYRYQRPHSWEGHRP